MKMILKKPPLWLTIIAIVILFAAVGCDKSETPINGNMLYVKTELGGCNIGNSIKRSNSDIESDTVIITTSEDSVNVFVGINFTCKRDPFETQIEIIDDVVYMHIIDTCDGYDEIRGDCYMRCYCYYTFDFVFKYQGEINQKYKILLHKNFRNDGEYPISIISEGVINSKKR